MGDLERDELIDKCADDFEERMREAPQEHYTLKIIAAAEEMIERAEEEAEERVEREADVIREQAEQEAKEYVDSLEEEEAES